MCCVITFAKTIKRILDANKLSKEGENHLMENTVTTPQGPQVGDQLEAEITDIAQNPDTSRIFMFLPSFERDKPLETFSTSTTLRVRRSVRCLGLHSRRNIRKNE